MAEGEAQGGAVAPAEVEFPFRAAKAEEWEVDIPVLAGLGPLGAIVDQFRVVGEANDKEEEIVQWIAEAPEEFANPERLVRVEVRMGGRAVRIEAVNRVVGVAEPPEGIDFLIPRIAHGIFDF